MKISSNAFEHGGWIPVKYTCEGEDISPQLDIADVPDGTQSLALIVDDPDAPMGIWVHWVVYDIPVIERIDENSVPGMQGTNDFKRQDYGGPCPPSGTHRYYFKLYALDRKLELSPGITKDDLERIMAPHVLEETELMGRYRKESQG
jgi:Raf kinase inhibitor-like YbhB/YbcL family protein